MRIARYCFCIIFFVFNQAGWAQNTEADSLKKLLTGHREDTLKADILISICMNVFRAAPDTAIVYGKEALDLAERLSYGKGAANASKFIGMGYYFLGDYAETITYWQQSLGWFEAINDKRGVSNILSNLGALYANQGDDVQAIDFHLRSLKAAEEAKDTLRIVTSMINIGVVYLNNPKTHDIALGYNLSALPLSEKLGNNDAIGTVSVNLGEIYFHRESYDTALYYYEKSLNAFRKSNSGNVPYTLTNIGKVYMKRGDFQKAIEFQQEAYRIAESSNAKLEMTSTLLGLAGTYREAGRMRSAVESYDRARRIAEEIGAKNELKQAFEGLAASYSLLKDYASAFKFQALLTDIKDTLYVAANEKKIQFRQLNYELEKKETQISLLTKDKELQDVVIKKQKFTQRTFIIGFIIAILIAVQTYRNYRRKVRVNELLARQKEEIEIQNKNMTVSINYAERIQSAMFPSGCILSPSLFEYFILFKPLDIVSGDFYWFRNTNNSVFIAAADCTGHGVPGAFMSVLGISYLNELVNSTVALQASEVLSRLREHVIKTLHQKNDPKSTRDGMEMSLIKLDQEKNILQFSGARRPLYLIRDSNLSELAGDKIPLGIHFDANDTFNDKEIEIRKNDIVYLFSDGFADQIGGPEKKTLKAKRFKDILLNNCHLPMAEQKELLEKSLEDWKAGNSQTDDILVIGIKFRFGADIKAG
jgi:serine phosphatase RsbU (regulator of sigma subunit)/Tfp pilus assembly protein PilF